MRPWKSSTVLLFNLAMARFFLNVVLPFRSSYYLSGLDWRFGDVLCCIFLFLLSLNPGGSIAFLTLIALDRYSMCACCTPTTASTPRPSPRLWASLWWCGRSPSPSMPTS